MDLQPGDIHFCGGKKTICSSLGLINFKIDLFFFVYNVTF